VPKTSCARKLAPAAKIARKTARETAKPNRNGSAETKLSRLRHPSAMTVGDWQAGLRREFGREQPFLLENIGSEPVFSEFAVTNPGSGGRYRVAIRGAGTGENFCACPDFATNDLGTCKHIEFTLARIGAGRAGRIALKRGWHPPYSEIYLDYADARSVRFRAATDWAQLIDAGVKWVERAGKGWSRRARATITAT
jgi:hypothetical protein